VGLVSDRIYPLIIRQETAYTAITYQRNAGDREYSLAGPTGNAQIAVGLAAWARTYPDARAIADRVRQVLDGQPALSATVQLTLIRDLPDEWDDHLQLYGCVVEATVMAVET
jgi:hypothetical protein